MSLLKISRQCRIYWNLRYHFSPHNNVSLKSQEPYFGGCLRLLLGSLPVKCSGEGSLWDSLKMPACQIQQDILCMCFTHGVCRHLRRFSGSLVLWYSREQHRSRNMPDSGPVWVSLSFPFCVVYITDSRTNQLPLKIYIQVFLSVFLPPDGHGGAQSKPPSSGGF